MFAALGAIWMMRKYGTYAAIYFALMWGVLDTIDYGVELYTGETIVEHVLDRLTFPAG